MENDNIEKLIQQFLKVCMLGRDYDYDLNTIKSEKELNELILKVSLFGKDYNPQINDDKKIDLAIHRAYLDFCRTIRDIADLHKTMEDTSSLIKTEIKNLFGNKNKRTYTQWHLDLCHSIINNHKYTFGQAQKWVNMTMKYLLVLDYKHIYNVIGDLQAPVDNDVIDAALNGGFNNKKRTGYYSWSSKKFSEEDYDKLQRWIEGQAKLEKKTPIEWEFGAWNKAPLKDN